MLIQVTSPVIAAWCAVLALASFSSNARDSNSPDRDVASFPESRLAEASGAGITSDRPGAQPAQSPSDGAILPVGGFRTKYAHFEPARYNDLPGWHEDNLAEAWKAFRGSCAALATRSAWSGTCARAAGVRLRNDEIRRFFEQEFVPYQIRNQDRSFAGVITGYYEPLLNGSRRRTGKYIYPVYGIPDDLLYLDARSLPSPGAGGPQYARVEGRMVIPGTNVSAAGASRDAVRVLDLAGAKSDIRDKKMRVRVVGDRIVPYYTRGQIEQGALDAAQVIVWVDNPAALYSMQVQGSGKVRLSDGKIVRLAYAEQNGHPFLPPVQGSSRRSQANALMPQTRGIPLRALLADDQANATGRADIDVPEAPATRGARSAVGASRDLGASIGRGGDPQDLSSEVARVVDILLKRGATPVALSPAATSMGGAGKPGGKSGKRDVEGIDPMSGSPLPAAQGSSMFSSDPSYVFFRQVPDNVAGPIGALGVPLTAGRSIAVDPRTTPLGFPVFVASKEPGNADALNRLMIAQDTGGAIRGAVRADYFWGFGPGAGERAGRMKQVGQMWLLLPKDQQLSSRISEQSTRGGSPVGQTASDAECVVPDPELCVE